jgi:hypothetical protein
MVGRPGNTSTDRHPDERVSHLYSFLEVVESFKVEWFDEWQEWVDPWFRGVGNATHHRLLPSALRDPAYDEDGHRYEFKLRAFPYLSDTWIQPRSEWDWYFLMQHYGLPTRLLDWSEAALIAAYFAVRDRAESEDDAAVWMLDPYWLNREVARSRSHPVPVDQAEAAPYLDVPYRPEFRPPDPPLAIQPAFNSRRISAQRGQFTIHGGSPRPLEDYDLGRHLVRIRIDGASIDGFKYELATAGVTDATVFPDLGGLCREILDSRKDRFVVTDPRAGRRARRRPPADPR